MVLQDSEQEGEEGKSQETAAGDASQQPASTEQAAGTEQPAGSEQPVSTEQPAESQQQQQQQSAESGEKRMLDRTVGSLCVCVFAVSV